MADQDKPVTGRCLCGDIRYEYRGTPTNSSYCHCDSCRRHVSGPVAAFVCVRRETFRFTQGAPVAYASSARVTRTHCGRCGSPIASRKRSLSGGSTPPNGDRNNGDDPDKRRRPDPKLNGKDATTQEKRFACPYYKRNPGRHQTFTSCRDPGFITVARLK